MAKTNPKHKTLIKQAIKQTTTMRQAASKINWHYRTFIERAKKYNLYKPNQGGKGTSKPNSGKNQKYELEDILNGKYPSYNTNLLKKRLLKENIKQNICECCGIDEWNGDSIIMELDHKDGDNQNHSLDNLTMLCPNCHSQTGTFRGRNKQKKKENNYVSDVKLLKSLQETTNIRQALLNVGLEPKGANYKKADRLLELLKHI